MVYTPLIRTNLNMNHICDMQLGPWCGWFWCQHPEDNCVVIATHPTYYYFYELYQHFWTAVFTWLSILVITVVPHNPRSYSIIWKIHCNYWVFPKVLEMVVEFLSLSKALCWVNEAFECSRELGCPSRSIFFYSFSLLINDSETIKLL